MGKIFLPDDVERDRVPQIGSFAQVADHLRTALATDCFASALLFGSVVRGDATIRSDVDCAYCAHMAHASQVQAVLREAHVYAKRLYVPISFVPCDYVAAQTKLHFFGPAFLSHLRSSSRGGGIIRGDFCSMFQRNVDVQTEIEAYLRNKLYSLQEGWAHFAVYTPDRQARYLSKVYKSIMHVARRVLVYTDQLQGDMKRSVADRYVEMMPERLGGWFAHLHTIDDQYTKALVGCVEGGSMQAYGYMYLHMIDQVPDVIEFVRDNVVHIDSIRS